MLCINNTYTDPFFNLAAEEYFLKNSQENIIMFYRNKPSVIIGKYQNVQSEVNIEFVEKHNIKIVRRYSGGGAVFHDLGNLNISFIENTDSLNFDRFTNTMISMLSDFGLNTTSNDRKALTIDGYKISGSAQGIYKNRIIYHATLLFSSDLASLVASLEGNSVRSSVIKKSRLSVKSVKSPVTNIVDHVKLNINIIEFRNLVMNYFLNRSNYNIPYTFSAKDIDGILNLKDYKYSTSDWNNLGLDPSDERKTNLAYFRED